jgi:UDPglucose 6-dehydrogenase
LAERGSDLTFDIASNPEFLKEGAAVDDFLKPDRIIVGLDSERAEQIIRRLYKPFLLNNHPIYFMDIPSAELTKYAANAMLAARISFMNEVANLCERVGADVNMVRRGIGSDPRIGQKFLYSGTGYGGSCFPKDVKAIIKTADAIGYDMKLMKAVELVNDIQKEILVDKILDHFDGNIKGRRFAIWGLSFKPQTDDMREAPALKIIEKLLSYNASIIAYDPVAMKEAERRLGNSIEYAADQYAALEGADGLILATEWSEFRLPQLKTIYESLREKVVFDGRNIYDPEELKEMGFTYYGIGRS